MQTPGMAEETEQARILRLLAAGTAAASGDEFFRSLAKHAALTLGARYAFVAESLSALESRSLAYWEGSGFGEGFSYRFPGTPCQRVAEGHVCSTRTQLRELYPEDLWLQQIGVDSYVGVPMTTADGRVLGHLAVLHSEPMEPSPEQLTVLQIFAARGCAELERVQTERALRAALRQVEELRDRLQAENRYLQEELAEHGEFEDMLGKSDNWRALVQQIASVAASDATVLIRGETGTGKELVARALHARSPRSTRPLVKVNCGAISAGLVESELFGHTKGAFTGALQKRVGRFELAHGGTIFLDEVGELPLETQVKLLRVLQEGEFEPVGSSESIRVDVRVIAATNRHLEDAMATHKFRSDLYFRLNVIPLEVPPLRERRGDVPELMLYFMERFARKAGKQVRGISTAGLDAAMKYDWPGNVRELSNIVERAVVLAKGPVLELDPRLFPARPSERPLEPLRAAAGPRTRAATDRPPSSQAPEDDAQRREILSALERANWVIEGANGAARLLNVTPSTARSRMKRLGIMRPA
jgi:transcriptional regulator with GAF, ATPase, and Fis domain